MSNIYLHIFTWRELCRQSDRSQFVGIIFIVLQADTIIITFHS